jgi:hypothetical protein
MKLVQIGNSWYTEHEGTLRHHHPIESDKTWAQFVQEVGSWAIAKHVSPHEFRVLKSEFGDLVNHLEAADRSEKGADLRQIALEDPTRVDKYVTYHAPVLVKQISLEDPTTVAKFDTYHAPIVVNQISLEDPTTVAKFDTYHAQIVTKQSPK